MRSTDREVKNKINAHILERFENENYGGPEGNTALDNLKDQVAVFTWMPSVYKAGYHMAEGGTFLIYTEDMEAFINSLGINPTGKRFSDNEVFERYCHLIGRQVAELVK